MVRNRGAPADLTLAMTPSPASTVVYDGSLAGLLCVVFDVFDLDVRPARVEREARHAPSMFGTPVRVASDPERAARVWRGLEGVDGFDESLVLRCWLYDTTASDTDVVHLCARVFRQGAAAARDFGDEAVFRCEQVRKKMNREIHRTHAFVRFAEAEDGLYLARIEPDFDVLPLAVAHFEDRYQDQEWIIWDERRRYGFWFTPGNATAVRVDARSFARDDGEQRALTPGHQVGMAAHEDGFQRLWGAYFQSVNIAARANPKLHLAHVPRRYWRHLTEKRPDATAS